MYSPLYTITNKILKNIGIIEACKEVIDHAPLLPYFEKKFRDEALIRTVHYGTHIEGNELNLHQAEKVLAGEDVAARDRDIQEIINYREVMEYIAGTETMKGNGVEEDLIKDLHKLALQRILPDSECGTYRTTQVVLKNSRTQEVSFRPPTAQNVPSQMSNLYAFINGSTSRDIHVVLKSGIVHYEFVRIHPFVDGNGRVGRALATLILFLEGYDIRKFFSLEEYFDRNATDYYKALQSVEKNKGDLTEWLEYYTEGVAIELSKIKERVEKISIDGKIREKLGGKPLLLTERQLKIIEYIQEVGYLQNQVFKTLFPMISEDTILKELRPLLENGIIRKTGVTKGAKYIMK